MRTNLISGMTWLLAAALLLAAPPAMAKKDSMGIAMVQKFLTMEPYQTSSRQMLQLAYLIWDPVVLRDADTGKILPHVATSWKALDKTTWEFKMRGDVKFHNGNRLTAEAIRYTIENRILDKSKNAPRLGNYKWIKSVEVVNDTTFRIHTHKPYAMALERLNTLYIMDPKWSEEKGFQYVQEHAMGSGPFKFVSWAKGSKIVLARNENYWLKGVPTIKDVTIKIIPENSTRLAELFSGGVDVALNLIQDQMPSFKKQHDYRVLNFPIIRVDFWNIDSAGRASKTPLMDVRVRRAIAHAVDRDLIVDKLMPDGAYKVDSSMSPYHFGFDPSIKWYKYDPAKARALLKEAGYPNGITVDLWQYNPYQNLPNQAKMQMLKKVGIKINLKDYRGNSQQMAKLRRAGKITGIGNFSWGSYNIFDADAILHIWFHKDSSNTYTNDPELSQWLDDARNSVDPEYRKKLYFKAQQRVLDQVYWIPNFGMKRFYGHHKDLELKAGLDEVPRLQFARWKN